MFKLKLHAVTKETSLSLYEQNRLCARGKSFILKQFLFTFLMISEIISAGTVNASSILNFIVFKQHLNNQCQNCFYFNKTLQCGTWHSVLTSHSSSIQGLVPPCELNPYCM